MYDISSIKRVTRNSKFLEVSTFSRAMQRNGREMYKKKCAARATFLFLVIRHIVVFLPFSLPLPLKVITNVTRTIRNNDL